MDHAEKPPPGTVVNSAARGTGQVARAGDAGDVHVHGSVVPPLEPNEPQPPVPAEPPAVSPARHPVNWIGVTSVITALTAVGAVIFSGLSTSATRDQIIVAREQARIAEQGQFTERYTASVAQIGQSGPAFLQVRLGGIYALERLAHDSPRDHPTIVEVLTAFVRTTTPPRIMPTVGNPVQECPITRIAPDVQAALTVLVRRNAHNDGNTRIDLRSTCLPGAELRSARLDSADLTGAYLYNADLGSASLTGAALGGANLTGARLTDTDMTKADLNRGYLVDADLSNATLRSADLTAIDLTNSRLVGVDLTDVRHQGAVTDNVVADRTTVGKWW